MGSDSAIGSSTSYVEGTERHEHAMQPLLQDLHVNFVCDAVWQSEAILKNLPSIPRAASGRKSKATMSEVGVQMVSIRSSSRAILKDGAQQHPASCEDALMFLAWCARSGQYGYGAAASGDDEVAAHPTKTCHSRSGDVIGTALLFQIDVQQCKLESITLGLLPV